MEFLKTVSFVTRVPKAEHFFFHFAFFSFFSLPTDPAIFSHFSQPLLLLLLLPPPLLLLLLLFQPPPLPPPQPPPHDGNQPHTPLFQPHQPPHPQQSPPPHPKSFREVSYGREPAEGNERRKRKGKRKRERKRFLVRNNVRAAHYLLLQQRATERGLWKPRNLFLEKSLAPLSARLFEKKENR